MCGPNQVDMGQKKKRRQLARGPNPWLLGGLAALVIVAYVAKTFFGLSGRHAHRRTHGQPSSVIFQATPPPAREARPPSPPGGEPPEGETDGPGGPPPPMIKPSPRMSPATAASRAVRVSAPRPGQVKAAAGGEAVESEGDGVPGYGRPLVKPTPYHPVGYDTPLSGGKPRGY